jgi:hypothetical protein
VGFPYAGGRLVRNLLSGAAMTEMMRLRAEFFASLLLMVTTIAVPAEPAQPTSRLLSRLGPGSSCTAGAFGVRGFGTVAATTADCAHTARRSGRDATTPSGVRNGGTRPHEESTSSPFSRQWRDFTAAK